MRSFAIIRLGIDTGPELCYAVVLDFNNGAYPMAGELTDSTVIPNTNGLKAGKAR